MTNLWTASHAATINPERFRAHNQYLEQPPAYPYRELLSYVHVQWPWLLDVLHEDEAFGCVTSEVDGKVVSRDLLDSACEIGFLLECDRSRWHATRNASASVSWVYDARVLDIGAGYGRFAHRMTTALPLSFVWCVDAIDVSAEVCDRYLRYREVKNAKSIPRAYRYVNVSPDYFTLAVNIHSWSECSLEDVRGWLDHIVMLRIPRLFIVPHESSFGTYSADRGGGRGESYLPELEKRGFRLIEKWDGPACCPRTYALFERAT